MTILNKTPVSLVEVREIVKGLEGKEELKEYLKKFVKISKKEEESLKKSLQGLNSHKLNELHIAKVIDFLPQNSEEVHKVFADVSLSEEEINAILEVVKKI